MPAWRNSSQLNPTVYLITGQLYLRTKIGNISVRFEALLIDICFTKMPVQPSVVTPYLSFSYTYLEHPSVANIGVRFVMTKTHVCNPEQLAG